MPRAATKLSQLDAAADQLESLDAYVEFDSRDDEYDDDDVDPDRPRRRRDRARFVLRIQALTDPDVFELSLPVKGDREYRPSILWQTRAKKISRALRAFAKTCPATPLPPTRIDLACRGAGVAPATLEPLLIEALAEALGRELPPAPTRAEGPDPGGSIDLLRGGPDGVRKWNGLKATERKAVDLAGADLAGLDLSRTNLREVSAKRASFAGATLARAELSGGCLEGADFAMADLQGARLKDAHALGAVFRGATLRQAVLKSAFCFGASFAGADLTGADLTGANLAKADLSGAILDGAAIEGASFDQLTTWPAGFVIPAEVLFVGRGTDPRLQGQGPGAVAADVIGLIARMRATIDPKRMIRTLDMLKLGRNQLFAEVEPGLVRGIVRSQRDDDLVYSCVLTDDGTYACCTPDLSLCKGLRGELCKHVLVLLIGLARAGRIDPATVDRWIMASAGKDYRWDQATKNHVSDSLLRYKGVEAGEVDWRPTETIPEDFYAL